MPRSIDSVIADRTFHTLPSTSSVKDAAAFMADNNIGAVTIVDDGQLKGILTERDLVFRVLAAGKDASTLTVTDVMTKDPVTIAKTESLTTALNEMRTHGFRHVPVMDGKAAIGMISARDMMVALHEELKRDLMAQDAIIFGAPIT